MQLPTTATAPLEDFDLNNLNCFIAPDCTLDSFIVPVGLGQIHYGPPSYSKLSIHSGKKLIYTIPGSLIQLRIGTLESSVPGSHKSSLD